MADLKPLGINSPTEPKQRQLDPASDRLLVDTIAPRGGSNPLIVSPVSAVTGSDPILELRPSGSGSVFSVSGSGLVSIAPSVTGTHPGEWGQVLSFGTTGLQSVSTFLAEISPEGVISAPPGSVCHVRSATPGSDDGLWVKQSGTGNSGWSQVGGGGVTDHGALSGLSDDDHTQYLLADGSRTLAGNLVVAPSVTIDGRDISADGSALDAHLLNTANPHATSISNIGSGTLAQLNAAISDADVVSTDRQVSAGAGLTGGGDLTSNLILAVGANADGSIVVNADDIQVGVLATDAQHGTRGGDTLHAVATTTTAGFLSAADKIKLDGIATGAVADHGALSGLADDDHTQYLLVDGTRAMSGQLRFVTGTSGSPGLAVSGDHDTGVWSAGSGIVAISGDAVEVVRFQAPSGADPQVLIANGTAAKPSLSFLGSTTTGFYQPASNQIGVVISGTERWRFNNAQLNGTSSASIGLETGNTVLQLRSRTSSGNATGALQIDNSSLNFAGSGETAHVGITAGINQSGAGGHSAIKINLTNTALGSGGNYFLNCQVGGTTVAGITNGDGRVLTGGGSSALPAVASVADPSSGLYFESNVTRWSSAGVLRGYLGSSITWEHNSTFLLKVTPTNRGIELSGRISTGTAPSVSLTNQANLIGSSGSQTVSQIRQTVAQTGTADYTALDLAITETSTGSGQSYLINAKTGSGGTTQVFGVTNGGLVRVADGSASAPSLAFLSEPDMGIFVASTDQMGFSTGGTERVRIDTASIRVPSGTLAAPGVRWIDDTNSGLYRAAADTTAVVGGGTEVVRFTAPSGADPQVLVADGSNTKPSIAFAAAPGVGFHQLANTIRAVAGGSQIVVLGATSGPQVGVDRGNVSVPGLAAYNDPDTGFYWPIADFGGDTLCVTAGGVRAATFVNNGGFPQLLVEDGDLSQPALGFRDEYSLGIIRTGAYALAFVGRGDYIAYVQRDSDGLYPQILTAYNPYPTRPSYSFADFNDSGIYFDEDRWGVTAAVDGTPTVVSTGNGSEPYDDDGQTLGSPSFRWKNLYAGESRVRSGTTGSDTNAAVTKTAAVSVTSNTTFVAATISPVDNSATQVRVTAVAVNATGTASATWYLYGVVRRSGGTLTFVSGGASTGLVHSALEATPTSEKWDAEITTSGTEIRIIAGKSSGSTTVRFQFTIEYQTVTITV